MKTALLLIDLQNDYFPGGKMELYEANKAVNHAKLMLDEFRKNKDTIIYIQHFSVRPEATFFIPGTEGVEIHDSVKPIEGEHVIVKHFPNSFRETDLLDTLRSRGIERLVICGMMTHMCVDATTRAAKDYGFNCVVIGDACATRDLQIDGETVGAKEVQQSFLAALNYFYSIVKNTKEYLK